MPYRPSHPISKTRRHLIRGGLAALTALTSLPLLARQGLTPRQSEGPFYPDPLPQEDNSDLTWIAGHQQRASGEPIRIDGQVLDEAGNPIPDALVEIWQANAQGRYHHERDSNPAAIDPHFQGWGKVLTDAQGNFGFTTIFPGAYPVNRRWSRPPHIHVKVARRGYRELTTQLYFAGEPLNDQDRLLMSLPADERARLIVSLEAQRDVRWQTERTGHFPVVLAAV